MSNVVPIRDLHRETHRLLESMSETLSNTPTDELEPGYRLTLETRLDLFSAIRLLRDAYHALRRA